MIATDLNQILVSFGVILASLDMALMASQQRVHSSYLTGLNGRYIFITTRKNFWEVLCHVCLVENLCWKKAKIILKINDIALFVIYLNYKWVHKPPKVLPIGLLLDCRQILQYMMQTDPPMPWKADGQWLCFHFSPSWWPCFLIHYSVWELHLQRQNDENHWGYSIFVSDF